MKVVQFTDQKTKEDEEVKEALTAVVDRLRASIQNGEVKQLLLQYEQVEDPKNPEVPLSHVVFWNESENFDQIIGFAQRLLYRLTSAAEMDE